MPQTPSHDRRNDCDNDIDHPQGFLSGRQRHTRLFLLLRFLGAFLEAAAAFFYALSLGSSVSSFQIVTCLEGIGMDGHPPFFHIPDGQLAAQQKGGVQILIGQLPKL